VFVCVRVQLYRKFEQSRRYQQVLAVAGGVLSSIVVAPLLSLLSVGMSPVYTFGICYTPSCPMSLA